MAVSKMGRWVFMVVSLNNVCWCTVSILNVVGGSKGIIGYLG